MTENRTGGSPANAPATPSPTSSTAAPTPGTLPEDGGQKPHVLVTASLDALRDKLGRATLATATPEGTHNLTASQARRLACDAHIIPVVLGTRSEPMDVGRTTRTVPAAMRKAAIYRDCGRVFPGCDRPPRWCDVHHVDHWLDEGPTSLGNLALLCRRHHTLTHHSDWQMTMDADGNTQVHPTPAHKSGATTQG
jgi:hypothetical protein